MRAVGDAGPYGGIDESTPVFEGAPIRAVGDAGPYGVRDRRHGEIRVGGVCPLGAVKRGTRERQRGETRRQFLAEPFCTAVTIGRKGNPKTDGFWRRSFPYFFRC